MKPLMHVYVFVNMYNEQGMLRKSDLMRVEIDKTYLVLDLTEQEQKKARLKASVYAMSVENLFKKALNLFEGELDTMECPYCTIHIPRLLCNEEKVIDVGQQALNIVVQNYPKYICQKCSSDYDDLRISMYVIELLRMEITECLHKGKSLPQTIDFKDLMAF